MRTLLRARTPALHLSEDRLDDVGFALDTGKLHIQALHLHGEPAVIDAEQVQNRRVQIAHVHRVLDDVVAEIVGLRRKRRRL